MNTKTTMTDKTFNAIVNDLKCYDKKDILRLLITVLEAPEEPEVEKVDWTKIPIGVNVTVTEETGEEDYGIFMTTFNAFGDQMVLIYKDAGTYHLYDETDVRLL